MPQSHPAAETSVRGSAPDPLSARGSAPDPPTIERLVAALQDPTRRGILLAFYADPRPRSVDDVAAAA